MSVLSFFANLNQSITYLTSRPHYEVLTNIEGHSHATGLIITGLLVCQRLNCSFNVIACPVSLMLQPVPQRTWYIESEADDILVHDQEMQLVYAQVLEI